MRFLLRMGKKTGMEPWERLAHQLYCWKNLQCIICVLNVVTASYLAGYIGSHDLIQGTLPAFVVVAGVTFIFTGLGNWFGHYLGGFYKRSCLSLFLIFDMACIGTQIAAVVVLTAAKLPWNCHGVADAPDGYRDPKPGYSTVAFGDNDTKGELDKFCPIPRMNWVFSLILLISYIHTMGWSIRLIVALHRRAKRSKADIEAQRQAKLAESPTPRPSQLVDPTPPVPVPEAHLHVHPSRLHIAIPIPEPPRQSVFDDNSALVSDGSWSTPGLTPAASPPAYEEEDVKKMPREKH